MPETNDPHPGLPTEIEAAIRTLDPRQRDLAEAIAQIMEPVLSRLTAAEVEARQMKAWAESATEACDKAYVALTAVEAELDRLRIDLDAVRVRGERLEEALEATTYLASLYRACWLKKPVRDLPEAEAWVASARAALADPAREDVEEER